MNDCERCGKLPPLILSGPLAGQYAGHDYCEYCSENLCSECMTNTKCYESADGKHHGHDEDGEVIP